MTRIPNPGPPSVQAASSRPSDRRQLRQARVAVRRHPGDLETLARGRRQDRWRNEHAASRRRRRKETRMRRAVRAVLEQENFGRQPRLATACTTR
ncbi:MAG: hypothetical protein RMK97_09140 [Sutterellaceae bacterium]|nr:hypothetical protein [Burkholderiaceae bacterium]MDW8430646.1 hypothetical protein [Sutterellaceae bacterium]